MNRRTFALSAAGAALAGWLPAFAQAWPDRPLRLWLSQPAGSGADVMARMISDQLARRWSQPIVVENRPGGQNAIGASAAAKSAADGYNFYFATAAALVTNAYLFKTLPYDPKKDFVPVGMVGKVPFAVSVNPGSQLKSMKDLVAFAKANPGQLAVANEGPKTFSGMMTRLLSAQLGIQVNSVSYVSVAAGVTDTVGGQTEVIVSDVPSISQMVKAGKLRPLAVTTARRVVGWESIPAVAESVLPGFDYAGWIGIVAPAGTPAAAIQRFNRDLDAVLSDKDVAVRLLAIGPITEGAGTVDQMNAFLNGEHARWTKLTKDIGILPE
ncbi:MAG TPA: tripartite tricarboxylate transporter substrate binding protein [Ramlibacter sp.]|nr:tripartite tricarboxylate transporter substrate binding protein [Ramlibacter sp.]